jgi:hypothetical protein
MNAYKRIKRFVRFIGGYIPSKRKNNRDSHWWMQCSSSTLSALIVEYIAGDKAPDKYLTPRCFSMSNKFKRGLLDGWLQGDCGNSSSKKLIDGMRDIATSLGLGINTHTYKRVNKVYNERHDLIHTLNIVDTSVESQRVKYKGNKICRKTVHNIEGKNYSQIVDISVFREGRKRNAYCLQVDDGHIFQLANGVLTHNCGLSEKHPNKLLRNWNKHQLTHHIKEARKLYHTTGEKKLLHFNEVYKPTDWIFDEQQLSHVDINCTAHVYAIRKRLTLRHLLQQRWNNLKAPPNPRNYFAGKLMPIGVDDTDNFIYQYTPSEYEKRWVDEGIDLSK